MPRTVFFPAVLLWYRIDVFSRLGEDLLYSLVIPGEAEPLSFAPVLLRLVVILPCNHQ